MKETDIGTLLVGGLGGIILAAVLATPFYGFGPVLVVVGALFVLVFALRVFGGNSDPWNRR